MSMNSAKQENHNQSHNQGNNNNDSKNKNNSNSNSTQDLLIEIGLEELPPKNLDKFALAFKQGLSKGFQASHLSFSEIEVFIAPRRLAALVKDLLTTQPAQTILKRGPAKAAAFDKDGKPTQAAEGFASACHTTLDKLSYQDTDKGSFLIFEQTQSGQKAATLIPNIIQKALDELPVAKRMRWADFKESFVRPVHWSLLLFGNTMIDAEFLGQKTSNKTKGHRFHHPKTIEVLEPKAYENLLETQGYVIPSYEKRRELIRNQLNLKTNSSDSKAKVLLPEELLDQVTGLVEWPVVLIGEFKPEFLSLPKEVLISAMQVHQKCFAVLDGEGKLKPNFLIVSNIESLDPKTVIRGNEQVMQARLHDAAFYYREDKKISLDQRVETLKKVIFQHGLGTLWDKAERMAKLARFMNEKLEGSESQAKDCEKVAMLCKTDLLTQMVLEFPELQGLMGRYYYANNSEIAKAIEEHYYPRFSQDRLPSSYEGSLIALADRIDTLVGIFGLGKRPSGDKDPFALRRSAMGVQRILIEQALDLDLKELFLKAKEGYGVLLEKAAPQFNQELLDFCFERLRAGYLEQNIPARSFEAVLSKNPTKPKDFDARLKAVVAFQKLAEAESLSAANKRVKNILEKSAGHFSNDKAIEHPFKHNLLKEEAEKALSRALDEKEKSVRPQIEAKRYTEALQSLASLKEPVDYFFDHVMVMVEDENLKNNRLALLNRLRTLFLEIADISVL